MKFSCTKENLFRSLQLAAGTTARPGNLPILSNVLIRATESGVELVSTNLELAVSSVLRAKVDVAAEFTVPAKTLMDYVVLLPEEQVHVSLQGNELSIQCGSSSTNIKGTPAEEFPVIPGIEEGDTYQLDAHLLKEALSQVAFAAAKNDIRPELAGVYVGFFVGESAGLTVAATDSYRLAERAIHLKTKGTERACIIPGKTASEFIRLLGLLQSKAEGDALVRLVRTQNQIALAHESFEVTSRLIEGTYPDYKQIIPQKFQTTATFSIDAATKHIKAASLFSTTGVNAVQFFIKPEEKQVGIASTSTQTGAHASTIDADIVGEPVEIVLNHRYVLEGLSHLGGGDIEMKLNGTDAPCVFKSKERDEYLYIVMPIRQ